MRKGKSLIAIFSRRVLPGGFDVRRLGAAGTGAQAGGAFPGTAEVDFFRKNIEPVFMKDRGGTDPGFASCVMCHTWQTSLRFALQTPANDAGWTPEQSRMNFDMLTKLVDTKNPESSRLLRKPLAPAAGGLEHTGGTFWKSREDPEYQTVIKWIRSLPADRYAAGTAAGARLHVLPVVCAEGVSEPTRGTNPLQQLPWGRPDRLRARSCGRPRRVGRCRGEARVCSHQSTGHSW